MKPQDGLSLAREAVKDWSNDKASRPAAALSYDTTFSLAPLLIVLIATGRAFLGQRAVDGQLAGQVQVVVGPDGAELIQTMIASASEPGAGIVATVIGAATLLFGATGLFGELKDALNTI